MMPPATWARRRSSHSAASPAGTAAQSPGRLHAGLHHVGRDFIITHFTKGAGIDTLPTEIYAELKLGIHPEMYALSTLVFVFVLVFAVLLIVNRRRLALGRNW